MRGTNTKLAGGGFHHVAMKVRDFDKSVAFYIEGLGFAPAKVWGKSGNRAMMMDTGDGSYLEIFEGRTGETGDGAVLHFALRTGDCDAAMEAVRKTGAEVTVEPKDVDIASNPVFPVRIAFFKGPDGEIVELFQER